VGKAEGRAQGVKRAPKKLRKQYAQAEISLKNLAKALNACEKAKVNVKLRQGIVISKFGYILPLRKGWTVRMLIPGLNTDDPDLDLSLFQ
jgi:hypothetical protein